MTANDYQQIYAELDAKLEEQTTASGEARCQAMIAPSKRKRFAIATQCPNVATHGCNCKSHK